MSIKLRLRHRSRLLGGGALRALWGRLKGKMRQFQTVGTIRAPVGRLRGFLTAQAIVKTQLAGRVRAGLRRVYGNAYTFPGSLPAEATVTGTVTGTWYESHVVSGVDTAIITLANTTWVAAGAAFDAQRQPIIDGFVAATSPANGWNAARASIPVTALVRTSANVATLTIPALPTFSITADQSITVTVPSTATEAGTPIVASPTLTLTHSGGATLLAAFSATDDGLTTKNGVTLYNKAYFDVWTGWSYDGTRAYRARQGDSGGWTELGFQGLAQIEEIYVSFRAYMPDGTEGIGPAFSVPTSGTNDKLLRVWGYSYGGTYNQKMGGSTWNGQAGGEYQWSGGPGNRWDMGQGPYANPKGDLWVAANRGRWLRVRFRCKQATAANNDGIEQVWVDDTLIVNLTTIENYVFPEDRAPNPNGGHNYLEEGYILGAWNSGAPAGQYMYLDDVRFSTGGFA